MKQTIEGANVPIQIWTDEVEPQALAQLKNIAALPWAFHHVAVMPDVHYGKGATVGSVIAMKNALAPAAVGVDIGCFTGDTQVPLLDGKTYSLVELSSRTPFHVYAATAEGRIVVAEATARKTRENASLLAVTLDNGRVIRCTPDHEFMLRDGTYERAEYLKPRTSLMPLYKRVNKDGHVVVRQPFSDKGDFAHKIVADSMLLGPRPAIEGQKVVVHHKNHCPSDNRPENLEFKGHKDHSRDHRLVSKSKHWQSPEFEEARIKALREKAQTEEGHKYFADRGTPHIVNYMKNRPLDFKAAVAGNGKRGRGFLQAYNTSEKGRAKSKEIGNKLYECPECKASIKSNIGLYNHRKNEHGFNNHKVVSVELINTTEDVFCLNVPGYNNFALDAGVFVHNCGMGAVKTNLKTSNLPDSLNALRSEIEARIPVGFNSHENGRMSYALLCQALFDEFGALTEDVHDLEAKARKQIGTLGGGNHFIELCLDTNGTSGGAVWMMLHSGSRNIGKTLAEIHIGRARKLAHNAELPDKDLAVFLAGTPEMEAYRRDLYWAQRYALMNRTMMFDIYKGVLLKFFPNVQFEASIMCHHNYVAEETHFGEQVFVTRKGAIRAGKGELGIVPGSMGTKSYIVRGLGNPESYESASHGAGRRMSRGAAKRAFTVADLEAQTVGVECRKDVGVLDEIPQAYKSIDQVMANQADLVEIVAELKQVLCVKG